MSNWVEQIVEAHSEFEPPLNFWRWAALATISAVVKDNVWINRGGMYLQYPNIYVMLHADSGMKKGPPVNLAKKLVNKIGGTKVYSGRSSIQGILKDLGNAESAPGGKIVKTSTAFICSSELSSSIVEDKVATTILTDLYDRNYNEDNWRSLLKMESFSLGKPTITMLTATNEAHADDFFVKKDIKGGYFARTFIVHEKEENRSNSLIVPSKTPIDIEKFTLHLRELSKLKGEFRPLGSLVESDYHNRIAVNRATSEKSYYSEAGLMYEEWYHDFKQSTKGAKDPTGTLNRFGDSVLKVAMLLSLAESTELYITAESISLAIEYCERLVGNVRQVTMGKTEAEGTSASRKLLLINELLVRENHVITQAQLLRKYWFQGSSSEWAEACQSLADAKALVIEAHGTNLIIRMTDEAVKSFTEHLRGRGK